MSVTAYPGAQFDASYQRNVAGHVGLVGVQIIDGAEIGGSVIVARTTAGVSEDPVGSGIYWRRMVAPSQLGTYGIVWDDDGAAFAVEELNVVASPSVLPVGPTSNLVGPCRLWVDPADVDCPSAGSTDMTDWVAMATEMLYAASGNRFPGACQASVRPCQTPGVYCGWRWWGGGTCGCGEVFRARLIPAVRSIDAVRVDGVTIDPSMYRLEGGEWLVPAGGWVMPACQDMNAAPDAPGSFVVDVTHGADPPATGRLAVANLACQLYGLFNGGACQLPANVQTVARQGVTYQLDPAALNDLAASSGIVGMFVRAFPPVRPVTVWSPDIPLPAVIV